MALFLSSTWTRTKKRPRSNERTNKTNTNTALFSSSRPCSSWPLLLSFRLQIHDGYVLVKLIKAQYNSRRRNATCCSLLPPCCRLRYRPNPSIDSPSPMVLLHPRRSLSPRTPVTLHSSSIQPVTEAKRHGPLRNCRNCKNFLRNNPFPSWPFPFSIFTKNSRVMQKFKPFSRTIFT